LEVFVDSLRLKTVSVVSQLITVLSFAVPLKALQYTDSWTEIEMLMLTPSETGCKIGIGGKGIATLRAVQAYLDNQNEGLMKVQGLRSSRRVLIRYSR
jgi:hypothetical protein